MSEGKRQLVEVIAALRVDIEAVMEEGKDKPVKFDFEGIELELKVAISKGKDSKGGGKIGFNIVGFFNAETGGEQTDKKSEEYAHVIKLKLMPKVKDEKTGEHTSIKNVAGRD